jgi:C1A family cysteine protease
MKLDVTELRKAIMQAGQSWEVREPAESEFHSLGWEPSNAQHIQRSLVVGESIARLRFPTLKSTPDATLGGPAGGPARPASFDWRTRGVIGPVRDQRHCGACVSFATTGVVCAMAAIEAGAVGLELSEADQHFASSHGPSCGGWNNDDAFGQIKSRGVSTDVTFPYMMAFDDPPVGDSSPDHLWIAHVRPEPNRELRTYSIADYSAHTGDDRKSYLATVGPLACGFAVYEDFDNYAGGVYRHVMGNYRGGHAVLVVGYSDAEQCWICRNSWGDGFGGPARADGTGAGYFKMGYGQCNVDSEPMYGCHGVLFPATLPVVTGVSRSAGKLDVFAAGTNDGTFTAAWQPGDANWRGWWQIQGGVAAPGTFIHVVSRSADHLDAFCVGTDHHVYTSAWQPGDTAWRGWWKIGDLTVAPNTSVTAVSRSANKLDIFAVGADQGIYTAAWQPGDTAWRGWWRVQEGVAAPNTSVFGVSRSADKLDIFCVGSDHGIYTAAWQAGDTSWRGWWRIQGGVAAPNTSVTAVSRSADKLDIFCVGTDHGIYTAAWQNGDTSWRGWWRVQGGVAAPETSVFGVSRSADKLDIFCVGSDHGIYTAAWEPGFTAWHGWWRLAGGIAVPGTSVYAVSRSPDRLDVFAIGTDHGICTAAWQPGFANWQGWSKVAGGVAEGG